MKFIFKIFVWGSIFCISACSFGIVQGRVNGWLGHSMDEVTAKMGAPASSVKRSDGGYTYTYITTESAANECRISFTTDSNLMIKVVTTQACI